MEAALLDSTFLSADDLGLARTGDFNSTTLLVVVAVGAVLIPIYPLFIAGDNLTLKWAPLVDGS